MKKLISILLAAMLVSSSFVLSGCKNDNGGSPEESVTESKSTNNNAADKEELEALSKEIETLKNQPSYSETKSVEAAKLAKNKRIAVILDSSSNGYSSYIAYEIKEITAKLGFEETVTYETDGTSSSYVSALDNVVSDQCSAVILVGNINKDEISSSIEAAQANGIKIISVNNANTGEKEHYVDSTLTIDYNSEAKALADYVIVNQNAQVNALLVIPADLSYSESMKKAVTDELQKYSSGYCTEISADSSTWGKGFSETVKEALEKDSNINCVIVLNEGMLKDTVDALEMTQAMSRVTLVSRGGGTDAFSQIQNGNAKIIAGESYEWTAYLTVDRLLKVLGGDDNPETAAVPFMMISYDNVTAFESSDDNSEDENSDDENTEETSDDDIPFIEKVFDKGFKSSFLKSWNVKDASESSKQAE